MPIVSWYNGKGTDLATETRATIGKIPGGYIIRLGPLFPVFDNGTLECRANNSVDPPVTDVANLHVLSKIFGKFSNMNVMRCLLLECIKIRS